MWNNSYYGNFRTRTFAEIFPDVETFSTFYNDCGIPTRLLTTEEYATYDISTIYALLISHYANNNIKSSDENRFKFELMSIIFQYAPIWQKEMVNQDRILALTEEEILTGTRAIYNQARNPSISPTTATLQELPYIDAQNTTNYSKAKGEAYAQLASYFDTEVTNRFIDKFKKLFIVILYPDSPLYYTEEAK